MLLSPEQYPSTPVYDLLIAAAMGQVAIDHRVLHAVLDRGDAAIEDLTRFFTEKRETDRLDIDDDLLAMARQLRTPAALPFLLEFARRSGFHFREELTAAFIEIGAPSLEPLLELHREANSKDDIAFALAALRVRDPRVLEILTAGLKTEPDEAAINLGMYGDPAAKPAIQAALAEIEGAGEEAEWTRRQLQQLIEDLDDPDTAEIEPYEIWPDFPEKQDPHFAALDDDELLEFFASPLPGYRAGAVRMLGSGDLDEKTALRVLEAARSDADGNVRAECWEALENALDAPGVHDALHAVIDNTEAPLAERAAALVSMALESNDHAELHQTILEFYEIPEIRAQAIKAMWHSMDRRFTKYIPAHLDDADPEVRRQAVWAVGWLGMTPQLGRIEKLFDDEDLRDPALYAYALAAPGEVSPSRVRKLYRKIDELAGGLTSDEIMLVRKALDDRLQLHGLDPIYHHLHDDEAPEEEQDAAPAPVGAQKPGRNDPCPCGSGKKYKKCCGA